MLTCVPLSFQYPRDISNQHDRLWDPGSPGPAFAKGFGEATSSRARRSFSAGGEPGEDRGSGRLIDLLNRQAGLHMSAVEEPAD
jgi:hypothetical protein